jgi:hypothetical protein
MLEQIRGEVVAHAGEATGGRVMEGSEKITAKTRSQEVALWVKGAMDRFDRLADDESKARAMTACGLNCSVINHAAIERGLARRVKFETEEGFLVAELAKPPAGTRMEREGDILYQIYTPASFRKGMRCFCSLMFGLPESVQASRTYCLCSRAFVKAYWSEVLGRPVEVEVLETAISGGTECRFKIMRRPVS